MEIFYDFSRHGELSDNVKEQCYYGKNMDRHYRHGHKSFTVYNAHKYCYGCCDAKRHPHHLYVRTWAYQRPPIWY